MRIFFFLLFEHFQVVYHVFALVRLHWGPTKGEASELSCTESGDFSTHKEKKNTLQQAQIQFTTWN